MSPWRPSTVSSTVRVYKIFVPNNILDFIFTLAFIEFDDKRDAEDAVRDLDDNRMNGTRVKLEISKGCKDKYRDFQRTGRVSYGFLIFDVLIWKFHPSPRLTYFSLLRVDES